MPPTQPDLNVRQTLPKVFLGSSSEGLSVAKAIQTGLKEAAVCRPRRWDQGVISLSQTTIEALTKAASTYDFAILVATPDDVSESRGTRQVCPRDNVLFETGLFVGTLGRLRTFLVVEEEARAKLPSDLAGVACAKYTAPDPNDPDDGEPDVTDACRRIKMAMKDQGLWTAAGPIPQYLFKDLVEILDFAKIIRSGFHALDTSHLHSLTQTVSDLVNDRVKQDKREAMRMESNQAWDQYSTMYLAQAAVFDRFLRNDGSDGIEKAFDALSRLDARSQVENCRGFCRSIRDLLRQFISAHDAASSILGQKRLFELLEIPGKDKAFCAELNRISATATQLTTQAGATTDNIVNLISTQQVTK